MSKIRSIPTKNAHYFSKSKPLVIRAQVLCVRYALLFKILYAAKQTEFFFLLFPVTGRSSPLPAPIAHAVYAYIYILQIQMETIHLFVEKKLATIYWVYNIFSSNKTLLITRH